MRVQVTFKSGAQIEFDADTIRKTTDWTDDLTKLAWDSGSDPALNPSRLFWLGGTLDDIQAIVTTQEATDK